ncbi:tryptophanyl-tRNA ligase [Roseivivax marinus]|uniref:Tryptophan--tRNA ligase n=1 Tax=Roseivivax marinus TaxID=1379903 RepID=W4HJM1_9RHOB|nr:tryptophan--tRNA ligase [Roseivivax marinus]ETW12917.1 tryptophanyl-tRNA ligase [Roseivivax marinus]SEL54241.1 tryptophanyl-tRNA synthetase [Roseivivax marinus]
MASKSILTGIKPTGQVHIGNYAGMIRPTLDLMASNPDGENFLFVANYHALNSIGNAEEVRQFTHEIAACFLALGLDLSHTNFYRQSDVPEVFELTQVLSSVTPKGLMNRAHAYKAAVDANAEKPNAQPDDGVNMGLYTYPILMSADILLFDGGIVPVGKDQIQHVEFARDIAGYFNRRYDTEFFTLPEHSVQENLEAIVGLDGRKMSKSYGNTIPLFGDPKKRRKAINKIVTDSREPHEPKDPDTNTVYQLYAALAEPAEVAHLRARFEEGGMGYGDAKRILADKLDEMFEGPKARFEEYMADRGELEAMMAKASKGAKEKAAAKIEAMRGIVGT